METVSLRDVKIISQIKEEKRVNVLDLAGMLEEVINHQRNAENKVQEETSPSVNHAKTIVAK